MVQCVQRFQNSFAEIYKGTTDMTSEAIVFVSAKCPYSNDILKIIERPDFKLKVKVLDIQELDSIPSFVDRVPMVLTHDEKVYHDENLFEFIKAQIEEDDSIEPFMTNEMKGMSDYYSFTGEEEEKKLDHVYSFVDKDEELITRGKSGGDREECDRIVNYDKYVEQRASEMQGIFEKQSPAATTA